jgi:hypothetical protein
MIWVIVVPVLTVPFWMPFAIMYGCEWADRRQVHRS